MGYLCSVFYLLSPREENRYRDWECQALRVAFLLLRIVFMTIDSLFFTHSTHAGNLTQHAHYLNLYIISVPGMTWWILTTCTRSWWRSCSSTSPASLYPSTTSSMRSSLSTWARWAIDQSGAFILTIDQSGHRLPATPRARASLQTGESK